MNFAQVEREVAKLRQDLSAGRLTEEECKAQMRELMVEDEQGNWWMVGYETGEWYRHDGTNWVPDQPPGYAPSEFPKPVPPATARRPIPHLDFYRELALASLGAAIFGLGNGFLFFIEDLVGFAPLPFAFIPSLLGMLFGPWPGGFAGALGGWMFSDYILVERGEEMYGDPWAFALCGLVLGVLPGLMVKDARDWKEVLRISVIAGTICVSIAAAAGALEGNRGFWELFGVWMIGILPINVILLPFFAHWLVGPVRRWGLYWRDRN